MQRAVTGSLQDPVTHDRLAQVPGPVPRKDVDFSLFPAVPRVSGMCLSKNKIKNSLQIVNQTTSRSFKGCPTLDVFRGQH